MSVGVGKMLHVIVNNDTENNVMQINEVKTSRNVHDSVLETLMK